MHRGKRVIWALLVLGLLVIVALGWFVGTRKARITEKDGGVVLERAGCYSALLRTQDRLGLILKGTCSDDSEFWTQLAARPDLVRALFAGTERLHLGTVSFFVAGPFLQCDVLARLARDRDWAPGIDSLEAGAALQRVLPRSALYPALSAVLASAGKSVQSVAVEMVLLDGNSLRPDCGAMPTQIPTSAIVDMELR